MIVKLKKYQGMIKDILLNLLSVMLVMVVIQLLIFPYISRNLSEEKFGQLIALYGINNMLILFLGNTLGNIRMLRQRESLDFVLLSRCNILASLVIMGILSLYYGSSFSMGTLVLFVLYTGLANLRAYTTVDYRISLQYKHILFLNFWLVGGYLVGLLLFQATGNWIWIFLIGEIVGLMYQILSKNKILKECFTAPAGKIESKMLREFLSLSSSNGLANLSNYLDRFMITPLLGAASMGIFYAASSLSKVLTMVITPMSSVLLSYTANHEAGYARKKLLLLYGVLTCGLLPCYFILNVTSRFLVNLLYPAYAASAEKLIPIVVVGILLNVIYSILHPFILKNYSLHYQLLIQLVYLLFYAVLSILWSKYYRLTGFTTAFSVASFIKLLLQLSIVVFQKEKEQPMKEFF